MATEVRKINRVKLVYFTGTGSTERVAESLEKELVKEHISVNRFKLQYGQHPSNFSEQEDLLMILYPVHALNAPEPIYEWIRHAEQAKGTRAAVISVSGGGETTPNTACRVHCIKQLEKKGYRVTYEEMLVMPSNFVTATDDGLAVRLLKILPSKAAKIVSNLILDVNQRTKPNLFDRFLSAVGELEKLGSKMFGKSIKVTDECNRCGWCVKNCPQGNIQLNNGKPIFGSKCVLCLKCIYGCPQRALKPGTMKFMVIPEGFKIDDIEKRTADVPPAPVEALAKGFLWKGVKDYLCDSEEITSSTPKKSKPPISQ